MNIIDLNDRRAKRAPVYLQPGFAKYEQHYVQVQETWAQTIAAGAGMVILLVAVFFSLWIVQ